MQDPTPDSLDLPTTTRCATTASTGRTCAYDMKLDDVSRPGRPDASSRSSRRLAPAGGTVKVLCCPRRRRHDPQGDRRATPPTCRTRGPAACPTARCRRRERPAGAGDGMAKFVPPADRPAADRAGRAKAGDMLFFAADKKDKAAKYLGLAADDAGRGARHDPQGRRTSSAGSSTSRCSSTTSRRSAGWRVHHPFTSPRDEDLAKLDKRPAARPRPRRTTSCSTARSSAAAASVSTAPTCSRRSSGLLGISDEEARMRVRLPAGCPELRHAAARRHRPGRGPHGDAAAGQPVASAT